MTLNQNPHEILNKYRTDEDVLKLPEGMDIKQFDGTKVTSVKPDELFAAIRTNYNSKKFNIIVEGKTDLNVYNRLVVSLGIGKVDYYAVGGREGLFAVYRLIKRKEAKHLQDHIAFIADQDSWVFLDESEKPPEGYEDICMEDIIWTKGYSIENDLYIAGRLRDLISDEHDREYEKTLREICTWYAFQVKNWDWKGGKNLKIIDRIPIIISETTGNLSEDLSKQLQAAGFNPSCSRFEEIVKNYKKMIPGKLLFQLVLFFLQRSGFPIKYANTWHNVLAQIAITVSSKWNLSSLKLVESLEEEVKCKLPELNDSPDSPLDQYFRGTSDEVLM